MRISAPRLAILILGLFIYMASCEAQPATPTPAPQLFYEDTAASQRVLTQLAVDNAGNVIAFAQQTSAGCPFGICGTVVYSIAPNGSVNWMSPDTSFVANTVNQIAITSNNSIFFQDQFATQELRGLTPTGSIVPGWPVLLGSPLDTASSTLLIDPIDQSILVKGGAASAFEPPSTRTASFRQDGTIKWITDLPAGAFNTPGMLIGPNNNVYTFSDHTLLLDRNDGHLICEFPSAGGDSFVPITGGDDLVFSYTTTQVLRADSACIASSIYSWDSGRRGVVLSYSQGTVFADDFPVSGASGTPRFIAISKDGVPLWQNTLIAPGSIVATNHGLVYVVGIDAMGGSDQKLFAVRETDGSIFASVNLTAICPSCIEVTVGSSGVYVGDLASTRIYKIDGIGPAPVALTVGSNDPQNGIDIVVAPVDLNGNSNGSTPFERSYPVGTPAKLIAPSTNVSGTAFSSWTGCDLTSGTSCLIALQANKTITANYLSALPSCVMPKRPVPKVISLDFGLTPNWSDKPHNGIDYNSGLGNMIQSVGPGGIVHQFTEPDARLFGSINPNGTGPAIWVRYTLATGDPIYVLYGHTATSWEDQSSGSGSTFQFDAKYEVRWKKGDLINAQTLMGRTAPFYNGGGLHPHLHISVFKPNKSCSKGTQFCNLPRNGWGYSDLIQPSGAYINPELFFTDQQYCLKP